MLSMITFFIKKIAFGKDEKDCGQIKRHRSLRQTIETGRFSRK